MSKSFRYEPDEARFLTQRYNHLVKEKNRVIARNASVEMEQWSELDLAILRDLVIDMAAIRKRQSEHLKIIAADTVIVMLRKSGAT